MNLQKNIAKKISFILIVSILSLNLSFFSLPNKSKAIVDTITKIVAPTHVVDTGLLTATGIKTGWDISLDITMSFLANIAKVMARKVIEIVAKDTVDWINGVDANGNAVKNPAFIADFNKFLTGEGGVIDQTIGNFFDSEPGLKFLCEPFRVNVIASLKLGYGESVKQKIGCTLTNSISNKTLTVGINGNSYTTSLSNNAVDINGNPYSTNVNNVTDVGGWKDFLETTVQPQNNPIGAYLLAKGELDARISSATGSLTLNLTANQGALSFIRCVDTYIPNSYNPSSNANTYSPNSFTFNNNGSAGNSSKSVEYTKDFDRPAVPAGMIISSQDCNTKTPGTAITGMLIQKSTTDQRMNELVGSLATGIDNILNALTTALIGKAMGQLQNGVLSKNPTSAKAYDDALNKVRTNAERVANTKAPAISNLIPTDTSGGLIDTSLPPTDWSWDPTPPTEDTTVNPNVPVVQPGPYTQPQGTGGGALGTAKNNAITLLNNLAISELTYQNNYKTAQNILIEARNVFATSSICNLSSNRSDGTTRYYLITSNVLTNIDGTKDSNRTQASIPWNLQVIKTVLNNSTANMAILDKAASDVNAAPSIDDVTDAMIPVNSNFFDTDSQPKLIENIKFWLAGTADKPAGVQRMYNSSMCPIDLTDVLKIDSSTTN